MLDSTHTTTGQHSISDSRSPMRNRVCKIILPILGLLLSVQGIWAQTSVQNFGTATGAHTSTTGSAAFLPNPTSGTTWARAGGSGSVNLVTASNPLGTAGAYVRGVASSTGAVDKFSPWVAYTGGTEFYTSFKVLFGDASAGSTATSGVWTYNQGAGAMYSDANDFAGAQVFTRLIFTYGTGGAIALSYRNGSTASSTAGLTTTSLSSATIYTIEIVGNNKTSGTINYTYAGGAQSVAVQKFDLYLNGSLIGDDLSQAAFPVNSAVASGTFIGTASASNVANIFVDDAIVYNAVPATIGNSVPVLTTPTASAITTTGATLGATITGNGGSTITSRGTVWGTSAAPTGNSLAEGGTAISAFSHARTGFTANTVYTYRGYAVNGIGTGYSADGTFTTVHNAPASAAASGVDNTSFTANWAAPTGGGAATYTYTLTYGTDPALLTGNTTVSSIASANLSQAVTGRTPNTIYYYAVTAVNTGGTSASSSIQSLTTLQNAPVSSAAAAISTTGFTANWSAPAGGGAETYTYTLTYGTDPTLTTGNTTVTGLTSATLSNAVTGLTPNTKYYYAVTAVNAGGTSASSTIQNATTLHNAPGIASATAVGAADFTANWTAPAGGGPAVFTYSLQYSTTSDFSSGNVVVTGLTGLSHVVSGLVSGQQYWYRVLANNAGGDGAWSGTATATTTSSVAPTLTSPTVSTISNTAATLGATITSDGGSVITDRGTLYDVTASPAINSLSEGGTATGAFSHSRTGLNPNTFYYFRGYATNSVGTSFSPDGTFTTAHNAPVSAAATAITTGGFTANWSAPTGGGSEAYTYTLEYSTTSDFSSGNTTVTGISSASASQPVTGLGAGVQVWYRVLANNAGGNSAWSATQTLTTLASIATLTLPTAAAVTTTTATLGATVISNGGGILSERGTVYDLTANPTANALAEGSTAVSLFTQPRTGFTPNTLYYYRGYAINSAGTAYSPNGTFTTLHNAPTSAAASSITSTGFTANWTAPTGGGSEAFTYTLQYSTTSDFSGGNTSISTISSANLSQVVSGLAAGSQYWYRVLANNAGGNSAWSGTQTLTTLSLPTVTTPTVTGVTTTGATLGATITADGGTALSSRGTVWGTSAAPTTNALAEGGTAVSVFSHARTGLTANTVYFFRGYAVNSVGTAYSADGTFTTLQNAPVSAAASAVSSSGFTANWTAPVGGGAATYTYTLTYGQDPTLTSGNTVITGITSGTLLRVITGLSESTNYYYAVTAVNAGGTSASSAIQPVTTTAQTPGVLLAEENFTFTGALSANGYTVLSAGGTNTQTSSAGAALSYATFGSTGIGNGLSLTTSGEDLSKAFASQASPTTIYAAFMVNVTAAQTGDYFFGFLPSASTTAFKARTFIKTSSTAGFFNMGISHIGTVNYASTPTNLALNTPHLVVVKYSFVSATTATVSLFVDPASLSSEPSTPEVTFTDNTGANAPADITSYIIRQGGAGSSATLQIDGIRIATGWGAATGHVKYFDNTVIAAGNYHNVTTLPGSTTALTGDATVRGTLTFTNGNITTGANKVIISSTGAIARTAGHVVGNLQRYVGTNASAIDWTVGDASNYTPVSLQFTGAAGTGSVLVRTTSIDHPNIASSAIDPSKSVNRYWTITNSGVTFTSYTATPTFVPADADIAPTANFRIGVYNGAAWSYPGTTNPTSTSPTSGAITALGVDLAIGEPASFTINASAGANGTIAPLGATTVAPGASQAYTITPDANYHVADVLVDGVSQGAITTYTFSSVSTNHTIVASFAINTFNITASVTGGNGTIAPAGVTAVNFGGSQAYTITPNAGYHVADVLVDGVSQGAITTYTFSSVNATHTIDASFAINTYTITASAGAGGSISPNGVTTVNSGAGQAYTISADGCSSIADVLVDGVSQGPISTYTFSNVTANHTISASFSTSTFTQWTGAVSTDWNDAANWTACVPDAGKFVYIPANGNAGVTQQPVLTADATTGDLEIDVAASITIGSHTLTIGGAYFDDGGCTLIGSPTSNLVFNSSATFSSTGTLVLKDLTVNGGTVTLASPVDITGGTAPNTSGTVTVAIGAVLESGGFLTLKSNQFGTARVAPGDQNLHYLNGDVTVERYIPNNGFRAWRLLAIPTVSTQTIRQAWQEGDANPLPQQNNLPNFGTQITGTGSQASAQAAGFDDFAVAPSLLSWTGTTWAGLATTNTPLGQNQALFLYLRGERSKGVTGATTNSSATTLRSKGELYNGGMAKGIPANSFTLMPNPFASAIDFTQVERTGNIVKNQFYIWDSKKLSGVSLGYYQTFSATNGFQCLIGGGSYTLGQSNTKIESGQAFFVAGGTQLGTLFVKESSKISNSANLGFRPTSPDQLVKIDSRLYRVTGTTADIVDANVVVFDNNYSNDIADEDAKKLTNSGENFGILKSTGTLVVEGRQPVTGNDFIQFNMTNMAQQTYRLEIAPANMGGQGLVAMLEDHYLNTNTPLSLDAATTVEFTIDANAASKAADRFKIVFSSAAPLPVSFISISANRNTTGVKVDWKVAAETNIVKYQVERSANGRNFMAIGTVTAGNGKEYSFTDAAALNTTAFYRVKSIGTAGDIKYTAVVKVAAGNVKPGFAISPNPVEGGIVNLQFRNQPKGSYLVKLISNVGQTVLSTKMEHAGGFSTQLLTLPAGITPGMYQVEILAADHTKTTQTVLVK